jgi:hypothetical protein
MGDLIEFRPDQPGEISRHASQHAQGRLGDLDPVHAHPAIDAWAPDQALRRRLAAASPRPTAFDQGQPTLAGCGNTVRCRAGFLRWKGEIGL